MNLQLVKNLIEEAKYPGGVSGLAEAIGMTPQNLHRCVRENKIQAQDLEKISTLLNVPINVFYNPVDPCCNNVRSLNIDLIKSRMGALRMNKKQLCELTGIARTTFDAILNGSDARISTLEIIAKALNLKTWHLFSNVNDGLENCGINVSCNINDQVEQLKSQLADKEKIIQLLEYKLSLCSQKN